MTPHQILENAILGMLARRFRDLYVYPTPRYPPTMIKDGRLVRLKNMRGIAHPDIHMVAPWGAAGWIEVKADGDYVKPEQEVFRDRVQRIPGTLWIEGRSVEQVQAEIEAWYSGNRAAAYRCDER